MSLTTAPFDTPTSHDDGPPLWPISVALFTDMIYAGLIPEKERVYLWKGRLAPSMTINRPHAAATTNTYNALYELRLAGVFVESEKPMALRFEPSVPQPDVKLVRGRNQDYPRDFPTTADVPLVVEVSDSSLAYDRKLAFTYAAEGIPVYWIVNIPGRRVEVFTEPAEGAYTRTRPYGPGDEVPVILDGREVGRIPVADLLP
ncbi:MAG: hypothetical protein JWN86_3918 [Planctomycetota bacterium]|nr:hypothetical protein [Planctomycetota bacterium]